MSTNVGLTYSGDQLVWTVSSAALVPYDGPSDHGMYVNHKDCLAEAGDRTIYMSGYSEGICRERTLHRSLFFVVHVPASIYNRYSSRQAMRHMCVSIVILSIRGPAQCGKQSLSGMTTRKRLRAHLGCGIRYHPELPSGRHRAIVIVLSVDPTRPVSPGFSGRKRELYYPREPTPLNRGIAQPMVDHIIDY